MKLLLSIFFMFFTLSAVAQEVPPGVKIQMVPAFCAKGQLIERSIIKSGEQLFMSGASSDKQLKYRFFLSREGGWSVVAIAQGMRCIVATGHAAELHMPDYGMKM